MYRLIAAVVALMLTLSAGPVALAAEVANAPAEQAPDIRPFSSAHFGMSGTVKVDGITVDVLGEGDLAVPDRQRSSFKFGPFTAEVIMVGETVYTRSRFEPRWSRQSAPQPVAIGPISASEYTRVGNDARLIGTEQVNGVPTEHYTSALDLAGLIEPLLPVVNDRDAREALSSLKGTVDVWIGVQDRMVRQERIILTVRLPAIEPAGDPMNGTLDLTVAYTNLNQPVNISDPARTDNSPLVAPKPSVTPIFGPAGAPANSTGPAPATGGPATGGPATGGPTSQPPTRQPAQAPAQVPRR